MCAINLPTSVITFHSRPNHYRAWKGGGEGRADFQASPSCYQTLLSHFSFLQGHHRGVPGRPRRLHPSEGSGPHLGDGDQEEHRGDREEAHAAHGPVGECK